MGYHSSVIEILTSSRKPDERQCQADSLTGAVASERVTEAPKGTLRMDGNHSKRAKSEGCLTARPTSRAGTKVGLSDPAVREWNCRRSTDKSYLGDNRLISPKSSHRRGGLAVRSLSIVGEGHMRGAAPSTRGPEWTHHWCNCCRANGTAGKRNADGINAEGI